ncbi:MAG: PQQ-binding-like beta-propeller repeat protein [Bacteroidota bacterium]
MVHYRRFRPAISSLVLGAAVFLSLAAAPARAEVAVVLNSNDDDISLIDTATHSVIQRVPIGKQPHHLFPTPDERYLIVGNTQSNELVFLDTSTGAIVRRVPNIADPYQLRFSPDGRWFAVNGNRLNRVDLYRYANGEFSLAARLPLEKTPSHLIFSHDSRVLYTTLQESDRVAAIDVATQKLLWFAPTGHLPAGIWVTPDGFHLLVGLTGEDGVDVLSAQDGRLLMRLKTGRGAHNFLPLGDGRHVLISNRVDNTISVIDEQELKVLRTFPVPGGPDDMELKRDGSELWVTSRWINRVSVIDMRTGILMHSIHVGRSPHGIYFHDHAARR